MGPAGPHLSPAFTGKGRGCQPPRARMLVSSPGHRSVTEIAFLLKADVASSCFSLAETVSLA